MICPNCNQKLKRNIKYCPSCGYNTMSKKKHKAGFWIIACLMAAIVVAAFVLVYPVVKKFLVNNTQNKQSEENGDNLISDDNASLASYDMSNTELHLILWTEETEISADKDSLVHAYIQISDEMNIDMLSISGIKSDSDVEIDSEDLVLEESDIMIGNKSYQKYSFELNIEPKDDDSTVFVLQAQMNGEISNTCYLYQNIPVTNEMVKTLCSILDDLESYTDSIGTEIEDTNNGQMIQIEPEEIISQIQKYLSGKKDVAWVWLENETTIRFITTDGLSSFYSLTEIYEDEAMNYCGTGTEKNEKDLKGYLKYTNRLKNAPLDTDVLVMCPVQNAYSDRKGSSSQTVGKQIAAAQGGNFRLVTDEYNSNSVLNAIRNGDMTEYGTVMLITHCSAWNRTDGSSYILPTIYSSADERAAIDVWNDWLEQYERTDKLNIQNCLLSVTADKLREHPETRITIGLNYTYMELGGIKVKQYSHYDICMSSNYIMQIYQNAKFPNTIFYLGACESYLDSRFNRFLIDRGASCIIGYDSKVQVNVEQSICKALFENMLAENKSASTSVSTRNYTILEAEEDGYNIIMESLAGWSSFLGGACKASLYGHIDFVYQGSGELSGAVVTTEGEAIENATITAYRYLNGELKKEKSIITDKKGKYQFSDFPWGMYLIRVSTDDEENFYSLPFSEGQKKDYDLELKIDTNKKLFRKYLSETLIPKYEIMNPSQNGVMHEWEDQWFAPAGIMDASILDFDKDDKTEMLVFYTVKAANGNNYQIHMDMYEVIDGNVELVSSEPFTAYNDNQPNDKWDTAVALREAESTEMILSANMLEIDGNNYIICEAYKIVGVFADGQSKNYWAMTYQDEKLQYAFSFTQTGGGSSDFEYTGYEFQNGILTDSKLYYAESHSDLKPLYHDFNVAITSFFDAHHIKIKKEIGSYRNMVSFLADENDNTSIFEFKNSVISSDYKVQNHKFQASLTRYGEELEKLKER